MEWRAELAETSGGCALAAAAPCLAMQNGLMDGARAEKRGLRLPAAETSAGAWRFTLCACRFLFSPLLSTWRQHMGDACSAGRPNRHLHPLLQWYYDVAAFLCGSSTCAPRSYLLSVKESAFSVLYRVLSLFSGTCYFAGRTVRGLVDYRPRCLLPPSSTTVSILFIG